jgi:hypothetical protein
VIVPSLEPLGFLLTVPLAKELDAGTLRSSPFDADTVVWALAWQKFLASSFT